MSTIKVDNLQTTSGAGLYPAKAWVNFNGSGTVAIRDDGNVSSITDVGTARYKTNWSTSFANINYCVTGSGRDSPSGSAVCYSLTGDFAEPGASVITTGFADCRALSTADLLIDSETIMLIGIN